jgi:hypothetical protein
MLILPIMISFVMATPLPTNIKGTTWAEDVQEFLDNTISVAKPLFTLLFGNNAIFGDDAYGGQVLGAQILIFALVMFFVYGLMSMMGPFREKGWLNLIIGALVSIIGIRFLPVGMLEAAAMPTSAFVAILVLALPFLLLYYILESSVTSGGVRRAVWACYAALIAWLWVYNWDNTNLDGIRWIYPAMILACLIAFWFDGTLQKWKRKAGDDRAIEAEEETEQDRIALKIQDLEVERRRLIAAGDQHNADRTKVRIDRLKAALKA